MPQRLHSLFVVLQGEELFYQYMCREGDSAPPFAAYRKPARIAQLQELAEGLSRTLKSFGRTASTDAELRTWGGKLYDRLLPPELVERLAAEPGNAPLALYLDPDLVWIPWELLWDGAEFFSRRFRIGRHIQKSANELVAAQRRLQEERTGRGALIVFGDVSGLKAQAEKAKVEDALSAIFGSRIWFCSTEGPDDILEHLKQDYEVCHFVGHGKYVAEMPLETGWAFSGGRILSCGDIEGVSSRAIFPLVIFANSCDSAHASFAERAGYVSTLYRAFLRQGVPQYIGTVAPIPDEASVLFSRSFYGKLAEGHTIGDALGESARELSDRAGLPIWPYYVHYGDPIYRLVPVSATRRRGHAEKPSTLSVLGRMSREEIQGLLEHYKAAVTKKPEDGEARYGLALCYLELGLNDLSIKNFTRALELMPEFADAYYYYGIALIRRRRPKTLALQEVRRIEQYLETAMQLDDRQAKYCYLSAILKFDYYLANGLLVRSPAPADLLQMAEMREHDPWEVERLLHLVPLRDQEFVARIRRTL